MQQDNQPSAMERGQRWLKESATVKLFVIGFIILLLLLPLSFVNDLVYERQSRQDEAKAEIGRTWGEEQHITGPFITIPFQEKVQLSSNNMQQQLQTNFAHFLPDQLNIQSELQTEIRSRGIFDVVVYSTVIKLTGHFSKPSMNAFFAESVFLERAQLQIGINDLRSLAEIPIVLYECQELSLQPGVDNAQIIHSGLSSPISFTEGIDKIEFSITLKIRGSGSIQFVPFGKETTAHIEGNWSSPSFQGSCLPSQKEITDNNFSADWKLLYMNRSYPQQFSGEREDIYSSAFGVDLKVPISDYQKNERSAKYAILIIALTFMVFFFVQVLNKVRIHSIQFMLVGFALCLFYVLLLSFTEHVGFNLAYFLSALLTIGLVSLYIKAIFKNTKLTLLNFLMLVLVYGFVFVIIQLEDYALLVGSLGLLLVLALAMYLSRNITWTDSISETPSKP